MPIFLNEEIYNEKEHEMIFVDFTEVREESRLSLGDVKVTIAPDLEALTGADLMISGLTMPATSEVLIRKHIESKALLIQRKHRMDLVSSLGDRLKKSIAKMRAFGASQSQCVLLFIGVLTIDREGNAKIDGQATGRDYWSILAGMDTWVKYGGVVAPPLSKASLIPKWLLMKERHVKETIAVPRKDLILTPDILRVVENDDPLQELVVIKDWRQTVLCCPGWGVKKVQALYHALKELSGDDEPTLIEAMAWMSDEELGSSIPGVGKGLVKKARDWMGLPDDLILTTASDYSEENK